MKKKLLLFAGVVCFQTVASVDKKNGVKPKSSFISKIKKIVPLTKKYSVVLAGTAVVVGSGILTYFLKDKFFTSKPDVGLPVVEPVYSTTARPTGYKLNKKFLDKQSREASKNSDVILAQASNLSSGGYEKNKSKIAKLAEAANLFKESSRNYQVASEYLDKNYSEAKKATSKANKLAIKASKIQLQIVENDLPSHRV